MALGPGAAEVTAWLGAEEVTAGFRAVGVAAWPGATDVAAGSVTAVVAAGPGAVWRDWYGRPCLCRTKPICELNPYGR